MKPAQLKIIQAVGDLAIPLLGYFFWNWDFYFILLFYILDLLVSSAFTFIKVHQVNKHRNTIHFSWKWLLLTILMVSVSFYLIFQAMPMIDPEFDFLRDTWNFLAYEEMGIAQGILLLPLLIYGGYMQYKMQFLMNGKFRAVSQEEVWKQHFTTLLLVLAITGIMLAVSTQVVFPHIVYILGLIFGATAYRFLVTR